MSSHRFDQLSFSLAAAVGCLFVNAAGTARAGDGPERGPHMVGARPLARSISLHNGLLSQTNAAGDDHTQARHRPMPS